MVVSQGMEKRLQEAFALVADALVAAGYPAGVTEADDLAEANESAIALENICENLYEFGCRVPARAYEVFAEVGVYLKVDSSYWEVLKPQVVG